MYDQHVPDSSRILIADRGDAGRRLDLVLRRHLQDVDSATRTQVQSWIEDGLVSVNGRPIRRASARAAYWRCASAVDISPEVGAAAGHGGGGCCDWISRYEDEHLLALNKPAGIVVHPSFRNTTGTLMNALLWHARSWPATQRPSLVGRLDKLTSGLVLVAKSATAHAARCSELWRPALARPRLAAVRRLKKTTWRIVHGRVNVGRGMIDLWLRHDPADRRRMIASADTGARSLTRFERMARVGTAGGGLSLLKCQLLTGRTHQIRVHLAARGWPIVGDPVYGEPRWSDIRDLAYFCRSASAPVRGRRCTLGACL